MEKSVPFAWKPLLATLVLHGLLIQAWVLLPRSQAIYPSSGTAALMQVELRSSADSLQSRQPAAASAAIVATGETGTGAEPAAQTTTSGLADAKGPAEASGRSPAVATVAAAAALPESAAAKQSDNKSSAGATPAISPSSSSPSRSALAAGASGLMPVLRAGEADYLPAGQLDARPFAEEPIVVPFPDASLKKGQRVSAILLLYIGADGRIDRVEFARTDLPPPFEKVTIATFMQARMTPGIKDGIPTRARMKIEVEFVAR